MFKTDSFLGNKKLRLKPEYLATGCFVALHYTYYGQNFIFWKAVLHLLLLLHPCNYALHCDGN